MIDLDKEITKFADKYKVNLTNVNLYVTWKDISDKSVMGRIRVGKLSDVKVYSYIWLDVKLKKLPDIFQRAVLWHEFVHLQNYLYGEGIEHDLDFQIRQWKEPVLNMVDWIAKLLWNFI